MGPNCNPFIKKTSIGISDASRRAEVRSRGYKNLRCCDPRAKIKYNDRYGTLCDEMGVPIAKGMRMAELETRLALSVNPNCDMFCLAIPVPHVRTAEAYEIVEDYCRETFAVFFLSRHKKNHKGERQEHVHVDVFNDIAHHPLNRLVFQRQMSEEIGRRFEAAEISFEPHKGHGVDQKTKHLKERKEIEAEMKAAFERSLYISRSIDDWTDALSREGLSVSRTTKSGVITLQNEQGYKMRLERLSDGKMKTKDDVIGYLSANNQPSGSTGQKEEVMKIEELMTDFAHVYARSAAALTSAGLTPEQISAKLCVSSEEKSRWEALRQRRDALEKGLPKSKLAELEKSAKSRGIDLGKALSSLNSDALTKCASGDAMPLLMALSNVITPMIQAAQEREKKEEIKRRVTDPVPGGGIDMASGRDIARKVTDSIKPGLPDVSTSTKGPGK